MGTNLEKLEGRIPNEYVDRPPFLVFVEKIEDLGKWRPNELRTSGERYHTGIFDFLRKLRWVEMRAFNTKSFLTIEGITYFQFRGYRWPMQTYYRKVAEGGRPTDTFYKFVQDAYNEYTPSESYLKKLEAKRASATRRSQSRLPIPSNLPKNTPVPEILKHGLCGKSVIVRDGQYEVQDEE